MPGGIGRGRCGGFISPSRAGRGSLGRSVSHGGRPGGDGGGEDRARADLRSRLPARPATGFGPKLSAHHALETVRHDGQLGARRGCSTPTSKAALTRSITRRCSPRSSGGSATGGCSSCCGVGCGRGCSRAGSSRPSRRGPRKDRQSHRCSRTSRCTSWMSVGGRRAAAGSAGQIRRRPRRPVRHPPAGRRGPRAGGGGPGRLGLRLHPEKTRIVHLARGAEGFEFLGFHHRMRESWKRPGRWYLQKWPSRERWPRSEARFASGPTAATQAAARMGVADLNPVLRGWGDYFRYGNSAAKFSAHRRLRQRTARDPRQRQARTHGPQLGHPLQLPMGEPACASTASPEPPDPRLRMPAGERCRRAVCGRTACTVRCGGGRQPRTSRPCRAVPGRLPPTLRR